MTAPDTVGNQSSTVLFTLTELEKRPEHSCMQLEKRPGPIYSVAKALAEVNKRKCGNTKPC